MPMPKGRSNLACWLKTKKYLYAQVCCGVCCTDDPGCTSQWNEMWQSSTKSGDDIFTTVPSLHREMPRQCHRTGQDRTGQHSTSHHRTSHHSTAPHQESAGSTARLFLSQRRGRSHQHRCGEERFAHTPVHDNEYGNPIELEAKNGIISRIGKAYNLPTPINSLICTLLKHTNQ